MADADTIKTIKTQLLQIKLDLTAQPKPTYTIDGQTVQWTEYLAQVNKEIEWCDKQLAGEEPFEIHSQGYT